MCPVCGKEYDISLQLLGRCSALAEKSVSVTNLLVCTSFVIKMQSEARPESEVLIVHVMAEVVCLQVRLKTRKCVALS